jgi:hypothetical protein
MWGAKIAKRIAPKVARSVDLEESVFNRLDEGGQEQGRQTRVVGNSHREVRDSERCMKCGAAVPPGTLLCFKCRRSDNHFWENCSGPALLFLGGVVGAVTLVVKALT